MVKSKSINPGCVSNLQNFYQNIRGLGNKTDELIINWVNDAPHILCLSENYLSTEIIKTIIIDNYNLGSHYCRKYAKCGGVCIFIHKSYQFINMDLDSYCIEQDFEVCAIRLSHSPVNLCVLSVYRSLSGNFDTFIMKLEEILNILFQNQVNLVICGDFDVNFMTNNTKKYKNFLPFRDV
jgi:exonuclease III